MNVDMMVNDGVGEASVDLLAASVLNVTWHLGYPHKGNNLNINHVTYYH